MSPLYQIITNHSPSPVFAAAHGNLVAQPVNMVSFGTRDCEGLQAMNMELVIMQTMVCEGENYGLIKRTRDILEIRILKTTPYPPPPLFPEMYKRSVL